MSDYIDIITGKKPYLGVYWGKKPSKIESKPSKGRSLNDLLAMKETQEKRQLNYIVNNVSKRMTWKNEREFEIPPQQVQSDEDGIWCE